MEIKDIFFSVGIVSSLLIGLFTLSLGFKNRRNSLREHLYKEQITFFSLFLQNINKLNFEIESLINNSSKRKENDFYEFLKIVSYDYYNYEFLIPNDLSGLTHNLIFKSNQFYLSFLSTDDEMIRKSYSEYFDSYSSLLNFIKDFVGTNQLSKENKLLYSQRDDKRMNNILKLLTEVSEKVLVSRF